MAVRRFSSARPSTLKSRVAICDSTGPTGQLRSSELPVVILKNEPPIADRTKLRAVSARLRASETRRTIAWEAVAVRERFCGSAKTCAESVGVTQEVDHALPVVAFNPSRVLKIL